MREFIRREKSELVRAGDLDEKAIKALSDGTRQKIIAMLAKEPSYPAEIASELGLGKQQAYYHFRKLEDAGLIEEVREEKKSGGVATFYRPTADGYIFDLGSGGEKTAIPPETGRKFLDPLVEGGEIEGCIVVGSPDEHGEDQVRARDGHLAGEIGAKLGSYGRSSEPLTRLDTEIVSSEDFEKNMLLLGGILTNTVTKKYNDDFPASFSTDSFPYHELETPGDSYTDDAIGVIQKIPHPENPEKALFMAAGIRNRGTQGAIRAFKNLEEITEGYGEGEFYRVVRGLDIDGDGEVDDYEVVE
jgi:DNA-binding transcriptional ArsR family regulator